MEKNEKIMPGSGGWCIPLIPNTEEAVPVRILWVQGQAGLPTRTAKDEETKKQTK